MTCSSLFMFKSICFCLIVLLLSASSFSWTIDDLLNEIVTVKELVVAGITIESLVESSQAEGIRLNKKDKIEIAKLQKEESRLIEAGFAEFSTATEVDTVNPDYFGDATLAIDASLQELAFYEEIIAVLEQMRAKNRINQATFDECVLVIRSLQFFHKHNKIVCMEMSRASTSRTYSEDPSRLSLHVDGSYMRAEDRARFMYMNYLSAYSLAKDEDILPDFFRAIGKTSGCLEARNQPIQDWQAKQEKHIKNKKQSSPRTQAQLVVGAPLEVAFNYVAEHIAEIEPLMVDPVNVSVRNAIAADLAERNKAIKTEQGPILEEHFIQALRDVFLYATPIKSPGNSKSVTPETEVIDLVPRKLFADDVSFVDEDVVLANHNSYTQVCRVQTSDGKNKSCRLIKVKNDGNCGFSSLRITREYFVQLVTQAVQNRSLSRADLRSLLADAGVATIDQWRHVFLNAGYWMNDIHLDLYARLLNITVNVYAVNHDNNQFVLVQAFNEGQVQVANLAHINLNPVMLGQAGHNMANNHFDELQIEEDSILSMELDEAGWENDDRSAGAAAAAANNQAREHDFFMDVEEPNFPNMAGLNLFQW